MYLSFWLTPPNRHAPIPLFFKHLTIIFLPTSQLTYIWLPPLFDYTMIMMMMIHKTPLISNTSILFIITTGWLARYEQNFSSESLREKENFITQVTRITIITRINAQSIWPRDIYSLESTHSPTQYALALAMHLHFFAHKHKQVAVETRTPLTNALEQIKGVQDELFALMPGYQVCL